MRKPGDKKKHPHSYRGNRTEQGKRYRLAYPEKYKAVDTLNKAIRSKLLTKPEKCEMCNKKTKRIHGHHADYTRILEVIWVCPQCHNKIHPRTRRGR
jgi:hypothetical protein